MRLRRLQREVSDLQRRLQEAKQEHRHTVSQLQSQIDNQRDEEAERAERKERAASESRQKAEGILREITKKIDADAAAAAEDACGCKHSCAQAGGHRDQDQDAVDRHPADTTPSTPAAYQPRTGFYDVVLDGAAAGQARTGDTSPTAGLLERQRHRYSFDGEALQPAPTTTHRRQRQRTRPT